MSFASHIPKMVCRCFITFFVVLSSGLMIKGEQRFQKKNVSEEVKTSLRLCSRSLNRTHCCYFDPFIRCWQPVQGTSAFWSRQQIGILRPQSFHLLEKHGTKLSFKSKPWFCLLVCFCFRRVPWLPFRADWEKSGSRWNQMLQTASCSLKKQD